MSNILTIEPTEFKDIRTGKISYGYRAYDDYGKTYSLLESKPSDDDKDFLRQVMEEMNDETAAMIDSCIKVGKGLKISSVFYGLDEIGPIIGAYNEEESE